MENGLFSKICVLSFFILIFSSLTFPLLIYLVEIFSEIVFIFQYQFFYQLQINFYSSLFKDILPYLFLGWLIFEIIVGPCLIKAGLSKRFKTFIYNHILKKKIDSFEFNIIKLRSKYRQVNEKNDSFRINKDHLIHKTEKIRFCFYQKQTKSNKSFSKFRKLKVLRNFFNKSRSLISIFSNYFFNLTSSLYSFWRGK